MVPRIPSQLTAVGAKYSNQSPLEQETRQVIATPKIYSQKPAQAIVPRDPAIAIWEKSQVLDQPEGSQGAGRLQRESRQDEQILGV